MKMRVYLSILLLVFITFVIGCTTQEPGQEISKERAENITLQYFTALFPNKDVYTEIINSSREGIYWKVNALIASEGGADIFTLEVNAKTKKPEYMIQGDNRVYIEKMVLVKE